MGRKGRGAGLLMKRRGQCITGVSQECGWKQGRGQEVQEGSGYLDTSPDGAWGSFPAKPVARPHVHRTGAD